MKILITEQSFYDAVNLDKPVCILENVFGVRGTLSEAVQYYLDRYNKMVKTCDTTKHKEELKELQIRLEQAKADEIEILEPTNVEKELRSLVIEYLDEKIKDLESMIRLSENIIETSKVDYNCYKLRLENAEELLKQIEIIKG